MMLEIDGWKVGLKFSASHFIPSHHKCSRIHGHDYGVRIRIYGEPKDCILYDFVDLKKKIRKICEELDHRVLIPLQQDYITHREEGDSIIVEFSNKKYIFPKSDVFFLSVKLTTAEELSRYFSKRIVEEMDFPSNIKGIEVCVDEGPGQGACYYTPLGDEK